MAIVGTKAEVEKLQTEMDKQLGYPKKGTNVGGGIHVQIPDTPGVGWTLTHAQPVEHPTNKGQWAIDTREIEAKKLSDAKKAAALEAKQDVTLDTTWDKDPKLTAVQLDEAEK